MQPFKVPTVLRCVLCTPPIELYGTVHRQWLYCIPKMGCCAEDGDSPVNVDFRACGTCKVRTRCGDEPKTWKIKKKELLNKITLLIIISYNLNNTE